MTVVDQRVLVGDCHDRMAALPDASVDAIVTDPPYGLEFMGSEWDSFGDRRQPGDPTYTPGPGPYGRAKVRHGMAGSYDGDGWRSRGAITATGYDDAERLPRPSYGGQDTANPTCATCGGRKRGARRCDCATPEWRVKGEALDGRAVVGPMRAFQAWCTEWATEAFRVLKPGGHLVAFGGSRTWHRLASAIEDAGFEVRDSLMWVYGSGFPKSLDVSKAIDKAAGAEREVVGTSPNFRDPERNAAHHERWNNMSGSGDLTAPATPEAAAWEGWGTALKPSFEPIVLARKPLMGSVATNVLVHGTGALNIAGCRIGTDGGGTSCSRRDDEGRCLGHDNAGRSTERATVHGPDDASGRWPANLVLDDEAADLLDEQTGVLPAGVAVNRNRPVGGSAYNASAYMIPHGPSPDLGYGDTGGASRFFYVAKADADERPVVDGVAHPTVKPLALMRWLIRLVTPPGGVVLDPFLGSGTTAEAALLEGFDWLGCERTEDYLPLIQARLDRFAAGRSPGLPQPRVRPQVPGQIDLFSAALEAPGAP